MDLITQNYTWHTIAASAISSKSKNSKKMYALAIKRWVGYLAARRTEYGEMTLEHLLRADVLIAKSFLHNLRESGLSYNTIGLYLSALRCFYDEINHVSSSLADNIFNSAAVKLPRGSRKPQAQAEALSSEQVNALLSLPDTSKPKGVRDYAILAVLFGIGIRRNEALNIRPRDIVRKEKFCKLIILNAKNTPKREVALAPWVVAALDEWITVSKIKRDARIFQLSEQGLWKMIGGYSRKLGLESNISSHSGRATVVDYLWNKGVPTQAIQAHMGHSSIRTTEGYRRNKATDESVGVLIDYSKDN